MAQNRIITWNEERVGESQVVELPNDNAVCGAAPHSNGSRAIEPRPVSLRELVGDTLVYGLASIADRAIGFVLLPVMTAILAPEDYGIISLFATTSQVLFILCSVGIHQSFFRHYTETHDVERQQSVLNTSLVLALAYWLTALPVFVIAGDALGEWIFGSNGAALALALAASMLIQIFDAVACNRLQAEGRKWAYFIVVVAGSLVLRSAAIVLVLRGMGAWGWVLSDTLGRLLAVILLVVIAVPDAKFRPAPEFLKPMVSYGAYLVPSLLSFYVMTVADKYLIRALTDNPLQQVGFYSVGERIASVMQLANLAFTFGWQRFAFRNMNLDEGTPVIARGVTWYAMVGGYIAMSLALLGDDLTRWIVAKEFEPGIVVIAPLTLAALFGGLASMAEIGLHKLKRPLQISYLNVFAALLNIGINVWAIPRWGIAGAAVATMFCQAVRLAVIWLASNAVYPLPLAYGRLAYAVVVLVGIYCLAQVLNSYGLAVAMVGQIALVAITSMLLWGIVLLTANDRKTILRRLNVLRTNP